MHYPPHYNRNELDAVREQLAHCFAHDRGLIMGSSAVVSRKKHLESREQPGLVHVLMGKDAGKTLGELEKDKYVHIDVFHFPAEVNIAGLAKRIKNATYQFLKELDGGSQPPEEYEVTALTLARQIHLMTGAFAGTVAEPYHRLKSPDARHNGHVHILAKLPPKYYALVSCIIEETEKALTYQGIRLRTIRQIIHIHNRKAPPCNAVYRY